MVFPYYPREGRYKLNYHQGEDACKQQDAILASHSQLHKVSSCISFISHALHHVEIPNQFYGLKCITHIKITIQVCFDMLVFGALWCKHKQSKINDNVKK